MKNKISILTFVALMNWLICFKAEAQTSPASVPSVATNYPWTDNDLIEPAQLAALLKTAPANLPLILNIGAVEDIKGAKHIGPVSDADNMNALVTAVATLPKTKPIVIYCGCCPFAKCPNVKPAFQKLKKMGFTDVKLLNLPVNLHTNWIAKGYPLAGN